MSRISDITHWPGYSRSTSDTRMLLLLATLSDMDFWWRVKTIFNWDNWWQKCVTLCHCVNWFKKNDCFMSLCKKHCWCCHIVVTHQLSGDNDASLVMCHYSLVTCNRMTLTDGVSLLVNVTWYNLFGDSDIVSSLDDDMSFGVIAGWWPFS